jgi:hypothetical protein
MAQVKNPMREALLNSLSFILGGPGRSVESYFYLKFTPLRCSTFTLLPRFFCGG